jgi:hypothetical protein
MNYSDRDEGERRSFYAMSRGNELSRDEPRFVQGRMHGHSTQDSQGEIAQVSLLAYKEVSLIKAKKDNPVLEPRVRTAKVK